MKSELQRYSMEIKDVPYSSVPQSYINEYEDSSGEWVDAYAAIAIIEKLEEQNKKLIDISKSLLQTFTPNKYVRVMMTREYYDEIEYVITNIEGEE